MQKTSSSSRERADGLVQAAMDARCYGMPGVRRSSLADRRLTGAAVAVAGVVAGSRGAIRAAACVAVAVVL